MSTRVDGTVSLYNELRAKLEGGMPLNASLRTSLSQYTEAREDLIDAISTWYEKSGIAIVANVDPRSKRRVKRVHDFVENMKRELRKTKPLGQEEEEEDEEETEQWLQRRDTEFPETIVKPGSLDFNPLKTRLRGAAAGLLGQLTNSPRKNGDPLKASTPESDSKKGGAGGRIKEKQVRSEKKSKAEKKVEEGKKGPEEGEGEEEKKGKEEEPKEKENDSRQISTQIFAPATTMIGKEGEEEKA